MNTIYNKILIAMDDSDDSFRAAKKVIEIMKDGNYAGENSINKQDQPEIIAFHSMDHHKFLKFIPMFVPSGFRTRTSFLSTDYNKLKENYRDNGNKILNKTKQLFENEKIDIDTRLIEDQKPEEYIESIIEKEDIDLIALGSRGEHSKFEQILSPSVTKKVLNEIPCDVLIVR